MKRRFFILGLAALFCLTAGIVSGQGWTLKDSGVGLIVVDGDYATQLKIVKRGNAWDLKELYEKGALAGRYDGNQGFYAWLVGPHTDTYLDKNGLPVWNYTYTVTYPDGSTYRGGPAGFYAPGFAAVSIGVGSNPAGTYKIEWYIVNRDTKEIRRVAVNEFMGTW